MDKNRLDRSNNGIVFKQSDFSIDHILNKAGAKDSQRCCDITDYSVPNNRVAVGQCGAHSDHNECNTFGPMLNWLQYTRYRPPKLPKAIRIGPVKRTPGRLPRVPFTSAQLCSLEDAYKNSSYLSSSDANRIADQLDLTSTRVKIWFQNRRARERRERRDKSDAIEQQRKSQLSPSHLENDGFISCSPNQEILYG